MSELDPFHLAVPVNDLDAARHFYGTLLGCEEGRSSPGWIDFSLFGHQLVVHLDAGPAAERSNDVDGKEIPVPHFGVILEWDRWHAFAERLRQARVEFVVEPHVRFRNRIGEQATLFFRDPAGNALEFKAFKDRSRLFAKELAEPPSA